MINRSPTASLNFKSPAEVWLGKQPGYKHMRRFGSVAYVFADQGKLKPRETKGVFLGYLTGTKGYKVWLLDGEKCVVSRNVKFNEALVYKDVKEEVKAQESTQAGGVVIPELSLEQSTEDRVREKPSMSQGGADKESDSSGQEETTQESSETDQMRTSLTNYQLARDRPRRVMVPPVKYNDYDCTEEEVAFAFLVSEMMYVDEPKNLA